MVNDLTLLDTLRRLSKSSLDLILCLWQTHSVMLPQVFAQRGKLHFCCVLYFACLGGRCLFKFIDPFYDGDRIQYSFASMLITLSNLAAMGKIQENI